jgi:uncharacterized membrane protein
MDNTQFLRGAIDAGACVSQAWDLVKRNLGLYVGAGLVTIIFINCIPFVNFFLIGPMMGGFAYLVLADLRDEPLGFGMLFKGFEKFVPLMVLGLIQAVPAIVMQLAQYVLDLGSLLGGVGTTAADYQASSGGLSALQTGAVAGMIILFICYFIFQAFWNAALTFAIPLIVERNATIGDAISVSFGAVFANLGGLILLVIINIGVVLLGVLACFFGIFVAIPVTWVSYVIAYRHVFPSIDGTRFNTGPPPPEAYGNFGSPQ